MKVRSRRDRLITYEVYQSELLRRWVCTCPDWQNRKMQLGQDCKHIKEVKQQIEDEKMREATKEKKKKAGPQVRTWAPAYDDLGELAKQLFVKYPMAHRLIGITRPSRKVALDYMRVRCTLNTAYRMAPQTPDNNYWLKICEDGGVD